MIRYLILTPFFPSKESFRGSYILDQVKAIQTNSEFKITVIILSSFFNKTPSNYEIEGVQCISFKLFDFPSFILPGFFHSLNSIRFKSFLVAHSIKVKSNTIVHGHINYPSSLFLSYLFKKYNCKTILQHHGLDVLQFKTGTKLIKFFKKWQNKIMSKRFIASQKDIVWSVGVSDKVVENIRQFDVKKSSKYITLYNGVDTNKFFPITKDNNLQDKLFHIGCIANFWKSKGQLTLLKSIQLLQQKGLDIQLHFVGSGSHLNECKRFVEDNNLTNCIFNEMIPHNELNSFYNTLDLFVLPSTDEALGCVYLEAWAINLPFIGIENQGIEELIPKDLRHRQLSKADNHIDLSEKIMFYYENRRQEVFNQDLDINNTIKRFLKTIND